MKPRARPTRRVDAATRRTASLWTLAVGNVPVVVGFRIPVGTLARVVVLSLAVVVDQTIEEEALRPVNVVLAVVAGENEATAADDALVGAGVIVERTRVLVEVYVVDTVVSAVVAAGAGGAGGVPHPVPET